MRVAYRPNTYDRETMREYQRNWIAKRRAAYFADKSCVRCGSTDRLELDHIIPEQKTHHAIWSWSESRRLAELEKCQVLCHDCHQEKTSEDRRNRVCRSATAKKRTKRAQQQRAVGTASSYRLTLSERGLAMSEFEYWDISTGEGLSDEQLHERYDDMLDEVSGEVHIGSLTYQASRVLKEVDPIAYRVGFSEWLDFELGETVIDWDPSKDGEV
jgi:5-methylcytosine-specific restriction endonuclease McrA